MENVKSEKGGITLFIIIAFLFIMSVLIGIYWKSTNYQITVLQAEEKIKDTYGKDVNNVGNIYNGLDDTINTIVL